MTDTEREAEMGYNATPIGFHGSQWDTAYSEDKEPGVAREAA